MHAISLGLFFLIAGYILSSDNVLCKCLDYSLGGVFSGVFFVGAVIFFIMSLDLAVAKSSVNFVFGANSLSSSRIGMILNFFAGIFIGVAIASYSF